MGAFVRYKRNKSGYTKECKVCASRRMRELYRRDPQAKIAKTAEYNRNNPEINRATSSSWVKKNPDKSAALREKRRSRKLNAIPPWADHEAIKEIYRMAKEQGLHVDHIVPLVSPIVCGLHVHYNLQLLTPFENSSKGNRYWPGMPNVK